MGHLDELYAKFKDKGLVVIGLTNEGRSLVDGFITKTNATHPIVIEGTDTTADWGVKGFPTSCLIDPDGKVVWTGHPASLQESQIEALLGQVRLLPVLPRKLAAVAKDLEKGKYADARKALASKLEGDALDADEKAAAEETVKWIDDRGASLLASAKDARGKGDLYESATTLEQVKDLFKGLDAADKAEAELKDLLSDADRKREVDAGRALAGVRERAGKMKPKQLAALYKGIAAKYKGTKAGDKAEAMAAEAEK